MSVNFSMTIGQALTRAYRLLGNLEPPWTPSDDQVTQGILAANLMQGGWEADGINLWRQEQRTISVTAGARSVEITPYVLGVEQASWVVTPSPSLYKRPMGAYSYVDYFNLPNPESSTPSGPSVYMFDKQSTVSTLWLWPVPTNGGTIICSVARSMTTLTTEHDVLDIPGEWMEGYVYSLADRLMDDQGVAAADPETARRITQHAVAFYTKLLNFDRPTSVFIRPWGKAGQSRVWR